MTLETAVVGGGDESEHHLSGLDRCPETELVAVCDTDESRARERARAYDVAAYADFEGLLARESLDWLHLCTPPGTQLELVRMALEDDVAVQLTAPVTTSVPAVEQLERLVADHGGRVSIAHQRNFSPAMRSASDLLADGAVGEVQSVSLLYTDGGTETDAPGPLGLELDHRLSEPAALLLHLAGYPESAASIRAATTDGDGPGRGTVQFHYQTADGVSCSASVLPGEVPCRSLQVHGERGRLEVDLVTQSVTELDRTDHAGPTARARGNVDHVRGRAREAVRQTLSAARRTTGDDWASIRRRDGLCHQLHREVRAIERGEPAPVPVTEGAWVLRLIEAISAETRESGGDEPIQLGTDAA